MKKLPKNTVIIVVVIIVVIIAAILFFLFRDKLFPKPPVAESDTDVQTGKKIIWTNDDFPLKKGSKGNRVKQLQAGLNISKNHNLEIDGKFGDNTFNALKESFNVGQLSESAYNTLIKPQLDEINDYILNHSGNNKPGGSSQSENSKPSPTPGAVSFIGKSIAASTDVTGYIMKKVDGVWVTDTSKPINYKNGQYVGVVQADNGSWITAMRGDGNRIHIMKSKVKIFN